MKNRYLKKSVVIVLLVVLLLALTVSVAAASGGNYHKVYYGETLYSIGRMYGVNPYRIADANNLYNPNHIYAGQVLYIPAPDYGYDHGYGHKPDYGHKPVYKPDYGYGCPNRHVVAYGENLSRIGYYYGVSPWAIANTNHIYNLNRIYAGQVLCIPSGYDSGYGHPMPEPHHAY